jgi:hypothetical protein
LMIVPVTRFLWLKKTYPKWPLCVLVLLASSSGL